MEIRERQLITALFKEVLVNKHEWPMFETDTDVWATARVINGKPSLVYKKPLSERANCDLCIPVSYAAEWLGRILCKATDLDDEASPEAAAEAGKKAVLCQDMPADFIIPDTLASELKLMTLTGQEHSDFRKVDGGPMIMKTEGKMVVDDDWFYNCFGRLGILTVARNPFLGYLAIYSKFCGLIMRKDRAFFTAIS